MDHSVVLMIAAGFIAPGIYFLIKNHRQRKHLTLCRQVFEHLFADINGIAISQQDRTKIDIDSCGLVYGEITFDGFASMLAVVQPKRGEVFYDLGAGSGKAVFCAALLYDWKKCCGIELLPGLYQLSLTQLLKFQHLSQIKKYSTLKNYPIQFIHSDFLAQNISDANIIFINATSFLEPFWNNVKEKLNSIKTGTRIIVASKRLEESQYQLLDAQMLPMSWGLSSVNIYRKI